MPLFWARDGSAFGRVNTYYSFVCLVFVIGNDTPPLVHASSPAALDKQILVRLFHEQQEHVFWLQTTQGWPPYLPEVSITELGAPRGPHHCHIFSRHRCVYDFLLTNAGHGTVTGRKGLYLALCVTPLKLEPITTMQTSAAAQGQSICRP